MANSKKTAEHTDDEILSLIEAFKYFDRTTAALKQAYQKLEAKIDGLRAELEEKNRLLSGSVAEAARTKNFLSHILRNMASGVIAIDSKGIVTVFNDIAAQITGRSPDEIIGRPYEFTLEDKNNLPASLNNILKTEKSVYKQEKSIVSKSGDSVPVMYSSYIVLDENENLLGAVEIFENLTEIKALQEEIRRRQTLVELGEMAASIAHEIRNPLGGIGGFAILLERDLEGDEAKQKLVRRIIKGINDLHKLTSEVLLYTRKMEPSITPVDVKTVLQETIALIKMESEEASVDIEFTCPQEDIQVEIDIDLLKRMLINLLKNAIQAMPSGGNIFIELSWQLLHNRFKIVVRDTGVGIEKEHLDKIFNPFFTTSSKGAGLGLAMVRRMVEIHNGAISVKSTPGDGAEFTIVLPILQHQ